VELAELRQEIERVKERPAPADFDLLLAQPATSMNARKINDHGRQADSIVRGMLLHSAGTVGRRQPTDINALLEGKSACRTRRAGAGYRSTSQSTRVRPGGWHDRGEQDLSRVFLNMEQRVLRDPREERRSTVRAAGDMPTLLCR
jgi:hypothetical protein